MSGWQYIFALASSSGDGVDREEGMWLALVVLGLIIIVFTAGRAIRRKARTDAAEREREKDRTPVIRSPVPSATFGELEELLEQIEAISRETNARLDTKIKVLEALVRQADERIAMLEAAGGSTLEPGSGSAGADEERFAEIYGLADDGRTAEEIARTTGMLAGEVELVLGLREGRSSKLGGR